MRRYVAVCAVLPMTFSGCGGSNSSSSGGSTANLALNFSPATADVDAGGSQVFAGYETGDPSGQGLGIVLNGPGSIATPAPGLFGGYTITYSAPGSVAVGSTAAIVVTPKAVPSKANLQFPGGGL